MVTEPELIKEILNNKDSAYPKMDVMYYIRKLLGDGLVTSEGEKWCKIRKLANHAFHADSLKVSSSLFCSSFCFRMICQKKKLWLIPSSSSGYDSCYDCKRGEDARKMERI